MAHKCSDAELLVEMTTSSQRNGDGSECNAAFIIEDDDEDRCV
jgi:hypothetical protein